MPEITDLMRVAQWAKSSGAPSEVYNAACRLLDRANGRNTPKSGHESHAGATTEAFGTREPHETPRDAQDAPQ